MNIIFEFAGGPHDGKTLQGRLADGGDAERYYLFTNHGSVGQRFKVASDYAVDTLAKEQLKVAAPNRFQRHYYVVTDRIATEDEVLVHVEYVPAPKDDGSDEQE